MKGYTEESTDLTDKITVRDWITHYEELLNDRYTKTFLTGHVPETFDPILDRKIDGKELQQGLSRLKRGKAAGPDNILG